MKTPSLLRLFAASGLLIGATLAPHLFGTQTAAPGPVPAEGPILVPYVVEAARALVPVDGQLFVLNPLGRDSAMGQLRITGLRVALEGIIVEDRTLDLELEGDPRFATLMADIERLPRDVTELHRPNAVAAPDAKPFSGPDVTAVMQSVEADLAALRGDWQAGRPLPFLALDFSFELDQLFAREDTPGTERTVTLELDWTNSTGTTGTAMATRSVTRLAAALALPTTLNRGGQLAATAPHEHAGDLHVHSCHGEAVGACAPSDNCGAESFQVSGSFSYAQLKSQYQALGIDWFTATDHSYCIDTASEYGTVVNECSVLTDGAFIAIPDTELSSDESGPQQGSDLGDAICLGATEANHMGAHGISSWKHGGSQAFWGFCDGLFTDELESFPSNINKIRAEGGYPIANHPDGSSFGWNSVSSLTGIESNDIHGIEIWNGQTASGQGSHVGMWVDWLEGGRILYAYSGSDTHDDAFAFGANHVVLEASEAFTPGNLQRGIEEGRVYLSNEHVLIHEATLAGDKIGMGSLQALTPAQQMQVISLEAHYNFGGDTGTITFFAGASGIQEAALTTSGPLTGQGVFTWNFIPWPGKTSWSRAYSESGSKTAYTNPIFYKPGTATSTPFGGGLGGANIGTLASASSPAIGASVELDLTGLTGATTATLAMSASQIPGGLPFAGGTLLIGLPVAFQTQVAIDGTGAGSFNFRMPNDSSLVGGQLYWQAIAITPAVPELLGFSNGLAMPIAGL
jgi:hypothetical protein